MAPTLKVDAVVTEMPEVRSFLERLTGPAMQQAAARGLTEHAHEQRRQSIVRIAAYTGVPNGHGSRKSLDSIFLDFGISFRAGSNCDYVRPNGRSLIKDRMRRTTPP